LTFQVFALPSNVNHTIARSRLFVEQLWWWNEVWRHGDCSVFVLFLATDLLGAILGTSLRLALSTNSDTEARI
jgi:hypothetical protein